MKKIQEKILKVFLNGVKQVEGHDYTIVKGKVRMGRKLGKGEYITMEFESTFLQQ